MFVVGRGKNCGERTLYGRSILADEKRVKRNEHNVEWSCIATYDDYYKVGDTTLTCIVLNKSTNRQNNASPSTSEINICSLSAQ